MRALLRPGQYTLSFLHLCFSQCVCLSSSLLASLCGMQDGCPGAPEVTRQGTQSQPGRPSPSEFHSSETGLGLAQFGQIVTPHPILCGQRCGGIFRRVTWPGKMHVERVLEKSWESQYSWAGEASQKYQSYLLRLSNVALQSTPNFRGLKQPFIMLTDLWVRNSNRAHRGWLLFAL